MKKNGMINNAVYIFFLFLLFINSYSYSNILHFLKGLDRGVSQLSIGERAKITIPSKLAYDKHGFPGLIPPNEDLVFDILLLGFT